MGTTQSKKSESKQEEVHSCPANSTLVVNCIPNVPVEPESEFNPEELPILPDLPEPEYYPEELPELPEFPLAEDTNIVVTEGFGQVSKMSLTTWLLIIFLIFAIVYYFFCD